MNAESQRLELARDPQTPWRQWGPCLSQRQWGTVREDHGAGMGASHQTGWTGIVAKLIQMFGTTPAPAAVPPSPTRAATAPLTSVGAAGRKQTPSTKKRATK